MKAPIVVFAVGNPSRGDDALGPCLLARFADWLADRALLDQFELIEDFQLQIEHALDLAGRDMALFIDAGVQTPGPCRLFPLKPSGGMAHTTHALSPEAVLDVYCRTEGSLPPPAFMLCLRGERFELGEPLTAEAALALDSGFELLTTLGREATLEAWVKACH
jgi:hydrogenase maturation protease